RRRRWARLGVPWPRLRLEAQVAASPKEQAAAEEVRKLVIEADLEHAGGPGVAGLLEAMASALAGLSERVRRLRVHVIGHSHIDMNWLWTWPDTLEVIKRDFASILALM